MTDYVLAFLFGALIIVVFAWDQFNRPSYEASRDLTRLVEILSPSRMRRRAVYWRAYAFYAGLLLLIYATLCAYGLLLAPTLGLKIPGYDAPVVGATEVPTTGAAPALSGYDPKAIDDLPQQLAAVPGSDGDKIGFGSDPTVPLFLSLLMVGLAPTVPMLQRIEAKIRFAAHRLSGIPTRLVSGARQLRSRPLRLGSGTPDGLLIPPEDWRRLKVYAESAELRLEDPLALHEDLTKIFALRSWILMERLPLENYAERDALAAVEAELSKAIERLVFTLDTLSGYGAPATTPASAPPPADQARPVWEAAAREADQICADLCVLAMLFLEHGVLRDEADADDLAAAEDEPSDVARQRALAEHKLVGALRAAARSVDLETVSIVLWYRATAATLLVALIYGTAFGADTATDATALSGGNRLKIGGLFMLSAALLYALSLLVAITWHHTALQGNSWRNIFREHWSRWVTQVFGIALLAGLTSLVCVVGYNIYATIGAVGINLVAKNWASVLGWGIAYEAPRAPLGAALAVCVIAVIDAWRAGDVGARWQPRLPWITAGVMFATGVGTRILTAQIADNASGRIFDPRSAELWRNALSAGVLAALIGVAVVLLVAATLTHEFPRTAGERAAPPLPAPVPSPAE